jgi:5-methylcytosine-specific restriction protein A
MDQFYSSDAWRALRLLALRRDRWCCVQCGASVRGKGMARVDHIMERKAHPALALHLGNLRTLCAPCDNRRHAVKGGGRAVERAAAPVGLDGSPAGGGWA